MLINECKVGQQVFFGRPNGQQTLAKIVKLNPSKAKVETLEARGTTNRAAPGAVWNVSYSMSTPAGRDTELHPDLARLTATQYLVEICLSASTVDIEFYCTALELTDKITRELRHHVIEEIETGKPDEVSIKITRQ